MPVDQTAFFELYDDDAVTVQGSNYKSFGSNLRRWFRHINEHPVGSSSLEQLGGRVNFAEWYAEQAKSVGSMVGSGELEWPDNDDDTLALKLALLSEFANRKMDSADFAVDFMFSDNNYDIMVSDIIEQIFDGTARDFARYLRGEFETPGDALSVPASDRVVTLNHNSSEYLELAKATHELRDALQKANDYPDEVDKAQRIAELSAAIELIKAERVRVSALKIVLGGAATWVAMTAAETIVGDLALQVWNALTALLSVL